MTIRPFDPAGLPAAPLQLIEASAGTGKTYSITSLYLRFILEQELEVGQILVLSFTEAATAELHARLRSRLQAAMSAYQGGGDAEDPFLDALVRQSRKPERELLLLRRAISDIDQAAVLTIHGFCHRILQQAAFESGMPFELELAAAVDGFIDELIFDFLAELFHHDDARLVALWRRAYNLPELRGLVREALRHRYFPLLGGEEGPADGKAAPWSPQSAAVQKTFARAGRHWQQAEKEIRHDLEQAVFLKSYRELLDDGLLDQLAAYLTAPMPAPMTDPLTAPPTAPDPDLWPNSLLVPPGTEKLTPAWFGDPDDGVCGKRAIKAGKIPRHPFFTDWEKYLAAVADLTTTYQIATASRLLAFARRQLPQRLADAGLQSFDDLLYGLEQALQGPGGESLRRLVAGRYPVVLIDEFQDTDPVQYAIFQRLYGMKLQPGRAAGDFGEGGGAGGPARRLILIGDPKQAIYAFRGADIFAYLQAARDAGGQRYTMAVNWRADRGMVAAVNALFQGVEAPFVVPGIDFPVVSARPDAPDLWREKSGGEGEEVNNEPLQFLTLPPELVEQLSRRQGLPSQGKVQDAVPALVAADIARMLAGDGGLGDKPLRPADIAVLVRTNKQAARIQEALRHRGVKAVLQSPDSVFAGSEARQLSILLHGLLDQADEPRRRAAMLTDLLGGTEAELAGLENDENRWRFWLQRFTNWSRLWRERGFMAMMRAIVDERQVTARLLACANGERRLTNFRHLVELLHNREREAHLQPPSLLRWLDEGIAGLRPGAEPDELRLESDEEAVQVLTVHRSKGLEFPVVYCPYLWLTGKRQNEDKDKFFTFHDPADNWSGKITLRPDDRQRQARRRELFAEELRLLYVALTRARHCCRVLWCAAGGYEESALAYLLHGGKEGKPPAALVGLPYQELRQMLADRVATESQWGLQTAEAAGATVSPPAPWSAGDPARLRQMQSAIDTAWRTGSFSHLIAGMAEAYSPGGERDYDAAATAQTGAAATARARTTAMADGVIAAPEAAQPSMAAKLAARIPLADLPAGAGIGNLWHRILELVSFKQPDQHREVIAEQLRVFGVDRERWQPVLEEALATILATPLTADDPFRLQDIGDDQRLNEMAFICPVRQAASPLKPADLARPFKKFPQNLPSDYAERLAQLRFPALQGYLKGFVDLVCQWQNKWYVIDYKSNLLGPTHADYQPANLLPVMSNHHYILQYHLYTLALHRHLAQRLPDYDYDRHCGGALYLFLRGLHPDLGPAAGIHHERPPKERIEALAKL